MLNRPFARLERLCSWTLLGLLLGVFCFAAPILAAGPHPNDATSSSKSDLQKSKAEIFQAVEESVALMISWVEKYIDDPTKQKIYVDLLTHTPIKIQNSLPNDSLAIKTARPGQPTSIDIDFSTYQKFPHPQGLEFVLLHEYAHLLHGNILDIQDFTVRKVGKFVDTPFKSLLLKTSNDGITFSVPAVLLVYQDDQNVVIYQGQLQGNQFKPQITLLLPKDSDLELDKLISDSKDTYLTLSFIGPKNDVQDMRLVPALLKGGNPFLKVLQQDLAAQKFDLPAYHPLANNDSKQKEYVADVVAAQALQPKIKYAAENKTVLSTVIDAVYYLSTAAQADRMQQEKPNPLDPHLGPEQRMKLYLARLRQADVISEEIFNAAKDYLKIPPANCGLTR